MFERLKALAESSNEPALGNAVNDLEKAITVGNITNSTGVAIGQNIRMVVNQLNLPAETAALLLDARGALGSVLGLDPARYSLATLLADKARDFVGRAYVFKAIDDFMAERGSGYFVIEGDPGMGKSSILAEYVRRTGCIAHFNVRWSGITSARHFLENICTQLIVEFGLEYHSLPPEATQDGAFLMRLLQEASSKLKVGERLVIAVDALDEVELTGHPQGANILFLPPTLPDKVYFILTRRDVRVQLISQAPQDVLDLMIHPAENRDDVESYIRLNVERPKLREWIARQQGMTAGEFVGQLAELSENNFMYLRYVLPEIEGGAYKNLDIKNLPSGLKGYYEDHWLRMGMQAKPLPREKIRIIYVMCEARQPVPRKLISQFATNEEMPVDELTVQEVLDEWSQFLREQLGPDSILYSIYHTSFRDFLHRKDIVQAAGVTIQGINALIADYLWDQLFGKEERPPA
jgi:hypothetical protein